MYSPSKKADYIQYYVWWLKNCSKNITKEQIQKDVEGVCRQLWLMDSDPSLTKEVDYLSVLRLVDYNVELAKEYTIDSFIETKQSTRFNRRVKQFFDGTGDW